MSRLVEQLVEQTPDAIFVLSPEGLVMYSNPAVEQLVGFTASELEGQRLDDTIHWHPPGDCAIRDYEDVVFHKDGARIDVSISIAPLEVGGRHAGALFTARDISGRKKAERARRESDEQIRQAQLDSIGQLTGGIAHDFNNLLTIITGRACRLLAELEESQPLRRPIEEISLAASQAVGLTRQLATFSRQGGRQPETFRLNDLVERTEKTLRVLLGENVNIVLNLATEKRGEKPGEGTRIRADAAQIEQVLINLALNARDAMPEGGTLWIETSRVSAEDELAAMCMGVHPGAYVQLLVTDTGEGMTPEVRDRCFEPFFTTKEPGKGTGLGLSTVHAIVKRTGGTITVHSAQGVGTSFRALFPEPAAAPRGAQRDESDSSLRGSETILLAEDEEKIREYVACALKESGYTVLAAGNAEQAIKLARAHEGPIDLLLTDFAMPGLNGTQVAHRLDGARRGIRVLLMSGRGAPDIAKPRTDVAWMPKPFTQKELLRRVRQVLDTRSTMSAINGRSGPG